ncbi:SpoIIE family protein phosphatase, partial [Limosilactobacillus reuteri]|uniref:SpoIIE family protein phosphatase n=1 Tax=Limosilactobacillus reuteri TaxID=1598 RepID=UPI00207CEE98
MTYASASHNPPLLVRKKEGKDSANLSGPKSNRQLFSRSPASLLGLHEQLIVKEEVVQLFAGDRVIIYT